jgi:hypothetical protein
MEDTVELRAAIENLYKAFRAYPLRDDTNACACCHSPEDEKRLHRKSLRKMNPNDLRLYATDALFVWGEVIDLKHFLPRIFELAAAHGAEFVDPQVVLNKLHHADWRNWPAPEQGAVDRFLHVLWSCVLEGEPHEFYGEEIEDWLCGIAQAVGQLSPYLQTWIAKESENARLNLAKFIASTDFANPGHRASAYWGQRAELFDEVGVWVRSEGVKAKMTSIAAEYPQYDFVERAYISLP